jgi:hypothetical protein
MSIEPIVEFYRDTEVGHRLQDLGREQGLEQGREGMLLAMVRARFGNHSDVPAIVQRLAGWNDQAAAAAITAAASPAELLRAQPPTTGP